MARGQTKTNLLMETTHGVVGEVARSQNGNKIQYRHLPLVILLHPMPQPSIYLPYMATTLHFPAPRNKQHIIIQEKLEILPSTKTKLIPNVSVHQCVFCSPFPQLLCYFLQSCDGAVTVHKVLVVD